MCIKVYMIWASENADNSVCVCVRGEVCVCLYLCVSVFQHVVVSALLVPVRLYVP